jgi:hypothetical protein
VRRERRHSGPHSHCSHPQQGKRLLASVMIPRGKRRIRYFTSFRGLAILEIRHFLLDSVFFIVQGTKKWSYISTRALKMTSRILNSILRKFFF